MVEHAPLPNHLAHLYDRAEDEAPVGHFHVVLGPVMFVVFSRRDIPAILEEWLDRVPARVRVSACWGRRCL